ncbi:hypothetical protein EV144_10395 [Flavobacterium sp. 270]|uniref:hypothetical protein n=1 Tax=Flavobacterium sp. 270 TaxID=2512114 RepID=UPI0010661219|nr:hypothetical protein [Flavobacterium sp. 270]TDW48585.1 hypothetical protein EV144_10395 [Flavobacterium sp. 270]
MKVLNLNYNLKRHNFWNSPTLMTWMSYSTKAITLVGILPLILKKFSPEDIVLWYLFSTIIGIQSLADFGFRQTFSRIISFAYGGAKDLGTFTIKQEITEINECNVDLLSSIISTMMFLYRRLTLIVFLLMATIGTWSMVKPVSNVSSPNLAWIAWGIVIMASCISFFSRSYMNFLEGLNKIALVRRVETLTSLGAIISSIIVLLWAPSLLNLVIANQFWLIVSSIRDWILCKNIDNGFFSRLNSNKPIDRKILKQIWDPAWRSGIGGLMSAGVTNITSIIYAQFGNSASVASYLLAIRLITQIREISMAPFYSKLPILAIFRVKNDMISLKATIKRGMRLSHLVFIAGFILTSILIKPFLLLINSEVSFVSMGIWAALGWAFFTHRFGAMHIQVYLTTNNVISHIADGISGLIFIISSLILSNYVGIYAIPVGMIFGHLCFYCWFTALYSYKSLGNESFWNFEKTVSIPSLILLIIFSIISLFLY